MNKPFDELKPHLNTQRKIGRIDSTTETALVFHHFDGLGQWEEEPAAISLDEITLVQFDTPYIKHFSKYVGGFSAALPK